METYGAGAQLTQVAGGGTRRHPNLAVTRLEDNLFHMEGAKIARFALRYSESFLERLYPGLSTSLCDLDLVIPHQASLLGLRIYQRFGWPTERIAVTLDRLGNCIAASIPVTLYSAVRNRQLLRGDRFLLVGTGAGLSMGGIVLTY
jgi:3-oxoacyl-[acyl-carrier-protein] synthase III